MTPEVRTREDRGGLLRREWDAARGHWRVLGLYERFEHAMVVVLTVVIAVIVVAAVWSLILEVMISLVLRVNST